MTTDPHCKIRLPVKWKRKHTISTSLPNKKVAKTIQLMRELGR